MVAALESAKRVGDVVVYELDQRLTREMDAVVTGQSLAVGDVCETVSGEKRQVTVAVNEVQSIVFGGTPTGGTFVLWIEHSDGIMVPTSALAHNASAATVTTALNLACGVTNGIVATGTTLPDQTYTFTYSGTGYAGVAKAQIVANIASLTGGTPTAVESTTTQGYASGSLADSVCIEAAVAVDEVQTIVFGGTPTGGTFTLSVMKVDTGLVGTTTALAYNASAATISTALDVVTGNTADIVATGTTLPDNTMTFTFSGGEYAGKQHRLIVVDDDLSTGGTPTAVAALGTRGKQGEAMFLTGGPSIVDTDQLDYNSTTEATVNAALLAVGISNTSEPTYTEQTT